MGSLVKVGFGTGNDKLNRVQNGGFPRAVLPGKENRFRKFNGLVLKSVPVNQPYFLQYLHFLLLLFGTARSSRQPF